MNSIEFLQMPHNPFEERWPTHDYRWSGHRQIRKYWKIFKAPQKGILGRPWGQRPSSIAQVCGIRIKWGPHKTKSGLRPPSGTHSLCSGGARTIVRFFHCQHRGISTTYFFISFGFVFPSTLKQVISISESKRKHWGWPFGNVLFDQYFSPRTS